MLRIVSHLESLLLVNDCVIVPRFGGFVLHDVSASHDEYAHLFRPMRRDIVFNTTLRYNDGLLTESYMKMYDLDYLRAFRLIEDDVDEIKSLIYENREVSFGTIGLFRLGNEGQIVFKPADSGFQSIDSYGLSSFQLKTVQSLEKENALLLANSKKEGGDTIFYIPVNRNWLKGIAGVAAAIAMFLVVSTPVKQMDTNAYTANFIPTEVVSTNRASASKPVSTVEKKISPVIERKVEQAKPKQLYYVIVSSLNSEKQADAFISRMDRSDFKRVNKLVEAKKTRVYADKFDNREQADAYMAKLRKNPKYSDAWVYIP